MLPENVIIVIPIMFLLLFTCLSSVPSSIPHQFSPLAVIRNRRLKKRCTFSPTTFSSVQFSHHIQSSVQFSYGITSANFSPTWAG